MDIKTTELEFTSQVITWLNELLGAGAYPFEVASTQPSVKVGPKKSKFPDVQIWLNRAAGQGFCGWELKTPHTPVDDAELLENAAEKARAMGADHFVTWNMGEAVIWRTPINGEKVSREYRFKTYGPIHQITSPEDLWVGWKSELLKARARDLLNDVLTLHRDKHLYLVDIDATFFVHRLRRAVDALKPYMKETLAQRAGKEANFREGLQDWAVKQAMPAILDDPFFEMVSRQVVYRLLGKILLYQTLRRFRGDIPKLDLSGLSPSSANKRLKELFEQARQIDYQSVFEEEFTDRIPIPSSAIEVLSGLIEDLNRFNFSYMPQDVVGQVYERLIPPEERHALGQYFTPENLVDLINAFCVRSRGDKILDPTCGTGTFLVRAYDRLKFFGERDHRRLLAQLWGIDIARFPAELATINLYRQKIEDYANFPKVQSEDFFKVKPGQTFKFPPPKPTEDRDFMVEENLPVFDGAVGNFPYIRQELIERRIKGYKNLLENLLAEEWAGEYPEFFEKGGKPKLSGQADIYAYLFFHTAHFVKDGGRMGFVTSNAWLDVAYGYELQKFFLKHFKIIAILESRCEPWFEDPAVNTIVTILERCSDRDERDNHLVKFVKVKKKLKELIPWDMKLDAMERWAGINALIHKIERAGSEHFKIEGAKVINTLKGMTTYEDDDFRIRVIRQGELLDELQQTGRTAKWGRYLRAPEVYFEVMEKAEDKLGPLKEVGEIRRGYTTGINKFFYLTEEKIKHWGIEDEFLAPVLKSPKEFEGTLVNPDELKTRVFLCYRSKEALKRAKKYGALKYIEWGEKQRTEPGQKESGGILYPEVPTVKGRTYWYALPHQKLPRLIWIKGYDKTFKVGYSKTGVFLDQQLYPIYEKGVNLESLAAALNSTLFYLNIELCGRIPFGEGLLWTTVEEAEEYAYLPDLRKFSVSQKKAVEEGFKSLLTRPIKSIFEEVKMADRRKLDSLVLSAIGLDPKKYLQPIYDGLCELVRERVELAKMRKRVKAEKMERDVEKVKAEVLEQVLPDGPKAFPEGFLDSKYLKDAVKMSVPGEPLKLGRYFMGLQDVVSEGGFHYQAKSLDEAKYMIYAQRPNSFVIGLPKNKIAISKAVKAYEIYLKELKGKLFETFFHQVLDHAQASRLTQSTFEELGLSEVAQ